MISVTINVSSAMSKALERTMVRSPLILIYISVLRGLILHPAPGGWQEGKKQLRHIFDKMVSSSIT